MSINIANVGIEVTRKCNMKCEHCLRGAAQRKTISEHHLYKFFRLVNDIGTLTITGGEPTLAMDSLNNIRHCSIYENCSINDFFMVTNGKAINLDKLAEWAYLMHETCHNNELSSVAFSFDNFHSNTFEWKQLQKRNSNYERLAEIMEMEYGITGNGCGGSFIHKHSTEKMDYNNLLAQGRAEDFGSRENSIETFEIDNYGDDDVYVGGDGFLYLSANGYIVEGCNWSYHSIDNNKNIRIAHIDDLNCEQDLIDALKAYNAKQGVETEEEIEQAEEMHEMYKELV